MNRKSDSGARALPSCIVAAAFLCGLGSGAVLGRLPPAVPGFYLAASVFTFLVYASDKASAKANRSRVPEKFLHLCALGCGWPGALAAQAILRHKTRKQPFRMIFWLTVVANGGALYWLLSVGGWR